MESIDGLAFIIYFFNHKVLGISGFAALSVSMTSVVEHSEYWQLSIILKET